MIDFSYNSYRFIIKYVIFINSYMDINSNKIDNKDKNFNLLFSLQTIKQYY